MSHIFTLFVMCLLAEPVCGNGNQNMRDQGDDPKHACAVNQLAVDFFSFAQGQAGRPDFVRIVGH